MSAKTAGYAETHVPLGTQGLWKHKGWQLPAYIQNVAVGLMKDGHDRSSAIAMAVAAVERWKDGGDKVSPEVQTAAAAAWAQWLKLRAQAGSSHSHSQTGPAIELMQVATAAGVAYYNQPLGTVLGQNGKPISAPRPGAGPAPAATTDQHQALVKSMSSSQLIASYSRLAQMGNSNPNVMAARNLVRAELQARGFITAANGSVTQGMTGAKQAAATLQKSQASVARATAKANAAQTAATNKANAAANKSAAAAAAAAKKAAAAKLAAQKKAAAAAKKAATQKAAAVKKAAAAKKKATAKKGTAKKGKSGAPTHGMGGAGWMGNQGWASNLPSGMSRTGPALDLSTPVGYSGQGPRITDRFGQTYSGEGTGQLAPRPTGDDSGEGGGTWLRTNEVHQPRGPRSGARKLGEVQRRSSGTGKPYRAVDRSGRVISYHTSPDRATAAVAAQGGTQ